jgi:hypothetical protein
VRGFGGGGASRFNPTRDPNHVSQEAAIKQHPPDGLKAGSGACDAPQQTGRDHRHHDEGNCLAAPLGPRLFVGLTLVSEKTGEERVNRIIASDIPPKRKGRPGRKAA